MATFYRIQQIVQDVTGLSIPNTEITIYVQPSLTLAVCYNDANGDLEIANPITTDGTGSADAYVAAGVYTFVFTGPQIVTYTLPDQIVGPSGGGGGGGGDLTTDPVIPTGAINGVGATGNRVYTLPTPSGYPAASQYFINGFYKIYGTDYSISGSTLTVDTALPLQVGDNHVIYYA